MFSTSGISSFVSFSVGARGRGQVLLHPHKRHAEGLNSSDPRGIKKITGCGLHIHLKWMLPFTVSVCFGSVNKQAKEVKTTWKIYKVRYPIRKREGTTLPTL